MECTNALAYMIVKDNLPLRTPEKPGFRKFTSTLQPLYKIPSEPTVTRFIREKYKVLQARIQNLITKASHITLAMDLWTHKNTMRSFLGMTCCMTKGKRTVKFYICLFFEKLFPFTSVSRLMGRGHAGIPRVYDHGVEYARVHAACVGRGRLRRRAALSRPQ